MHASIQNKREMSVAQEQRGVVSSSYSQESLGGEAGFSLCGHRSLLVRLKGRDLRLRGGVSGGHPSPGAGRQPDPLTQAPGPSVSQFFNF